MKIAIGADHAGFLLKEKLKQRLTAESHEVFDAGTFSAESVDYPDYAATVASQVTGGSAEKGVLVCFSGVGMSIAANKIRGIRAALGTSPEEVSFTRRHNNANVLTIGAHFTEEAIANAMVDVFLNTEFEGGRHGRRVEKIAALEQSQKEKQ